MTCQLLDFRPVDKLIHGSGKRRPVNLDHVSLAVKLGEVIGIVGRSASGKSTLTKLIQCFYVPEAGRMLIDGADLGVVDTIWLRRNIGRLL